MPTLLENFRSFSCTQVSTWLQSSLPLNVNQPAQQRTRMMVGESLAVFTKRVLVEKHISGIMYERRKTYTACPSPLAECRCPCVRV